MADQPLLDPSNLVNNVITPEEFVRRDNAPTAYALTRLDRSPDEAGEAAKIGQATDTSPSIIGMDLEHFQAQHKAALTQQLFEGNQHLRDYVAVHPFGADVSNDDWGQLDKISEGMSKFIQYHDQASERFGIPGLSTLAAAARGFAEGHGPGIGIPNEEWEALDRLTAKEPMKAAIVDALSRAPLIGTSTQVASEINRMMTGGLHGAMAAAEQWYINRTGDRAGAIKFARDMGVVAQVGIPEAAGGIGGVPKFHAVMSKAAEAYQVAKPWMEAGQVPPARINSTVLQLSKQQAREDAKAFDDLYKESQKSSTLARDPESFKTFADVKLGDATLGISADKVRELYGDGVPEPGDNKLGWAPHIEEQFQRALTSGYDIEVPWKDFLARASPEVYDAVKDGIRVRHDGLTLDEAKEAKPVKLDPYEEEFGQPYAKEEPKAEEPKAQEPMEAHDALSAAVGHGWEVAEVPEAKKLEGEAWYSWEPPDAKAIHYLQPTEGWAGKEQKIVQSIQKYLQSLLPKFDPQNLIEARQLKLGDMRVHGLYQGFKDDTHPYILYAMHDPKGNFRLPEDILGTVRHEIIHHLRDGGFFTNEEWKTLTDAAEREGWIKKYKIDKRYAEADPELQLEEAVAHEFEKWNLKPEATHVAADTFQRLREFFLKIRDLVIDRLGFDPKVEDLFHRIESGEIGSREPGEGGGAKDALASKVEDPELQRVFKNGRALGMNIQRLEAYLKLAKDQLDRDAKLKRDQAQAEVGAKATKEWEDNEGRVKEQVKDDLLRRPDIMTDRFLRTGELPDGISLEKVKLDPRAIDPEIRKGIPEDFLADGGIAPDSLAPAMGYQSGDQLVRSLVRLNDERKLQDLTPAGHLKGLVDRETQAQMQRRFGVSAQDIIDQAKEHVVGPTRLDMMTAEYHAIAESNGTKPLTEGQLKTEAKRVFDTVPVGTHSSDKYIGAMGREAEKFEAAMLEGKGNDAFIAKQRQILLGHQLKLALKLEKDLKSFDRQAPNWASRNPRGTRQEDAVWLNQIMSQIGFENEIGLQDLDRRKALSTQFTRLRDYVESVNKRPRGTYNTDPDAPAVVQQMPVADFLFSENYRSTVSEMLPPEFKEVFDSLKTIDHFSRTETKIDVGKAKKEVAEVVDGLTERLKAAKGGEPITKGAQEKSIGRTLGSLLLNPETWFNRLDLGNRRGPFNQLIVRPLMEGQYELRNLEKEFSAKWKALGELKDHAQKIENPGLWIDPREGYPIEMTKNMAYGVLQNMGNELQRKKLLMGWGIAKSEAEIPMVEAKVWSWLQSVGIGEKDLARARKVGDIFGEAFGRSEKTYADLSGVAPARIDLHTMQTPWGEVDEWYNPLIPDPLRYRHSPDINTLLEDGYHRPAPASGYTKERTGVLYPLHLGMDFLPFRLKQVLNDAAMRGRINSVGKIVYNPQFQEIFAKYQGKEYQAGLDAWIKDLAGNRAWVPSNLASANNVVSAIQNNLSTLMIGINLGTVLKHAPTAAVFSSAEVGTGRFLRHFGKMIAQGPGSREMWNWVMENSEEVRNRLHSIEESLSATDKALFPTNKGKFTSFRESMQRFGSMPVGYSDLWSSVAMWSAEYERLLEKDPDMSHGDAVYLANTAVRRTHGSSLLASRTGLMRGGPFWRGMQPFYNFFSNALQRVYEGGVFAKDHLQGKELPEMVGFDKETMEKSSAQAAKVLMGAVVVYIILPSMIESASEEAIGEGNPKESWAKLGARSIVGALPSQIPVVRDIFNSLWHGFDPKLGIYGSFERTAEKAISPKAWFKDPGTFLRTANQVSGLLTGLNYDPFGRAGQFWLNVQAGKEHPKGPWDYWKGTMRGTLKERR